MSTKVWSDPVQCYDDWAAGGSGVESVFRVPLAGPSHPDAYERVRAGMRARGIDIWFDGAGGPGPAAVLNASDRKSGYGLRLFSALVTPDRPVSDAIVIEVTSPCFTAAGASVPSSTPTSVSTSVPPTPTS
ncbi:hypothetical protein [Embleya sp. NPDC005971]|uniref:hypothetical protein n=1 Tax=Embleya sp. NPDC005971 TaxID=3156724 RepID=UPI0033F798CC